MTRAKSLLAVLAMASVVLVAAGCASTENVNASLGQEFTLAVGQTASIPDEQLKIKFVQVIGDSRCPAGVECFWQGEATCKLEVTYRDSTDTKVLTQPGLTQGPSYADYGDFRIQFNLQPYPQERKEIAEKDYRLEMVVSKKPSLAGGILATFDVVGESYSIFITNSETADRVLALQRGATQATIPSGRLVRGNVAYNNPWSWHIDTEDIHMAEVTMELCDGTPSQVEDNLDYWVDTVQRFCPWSARLVQVQDWR